jgi:BirA family biotin operon repressor/biotin-[acetyl-CoA-carboxylase] ligase
LGRVWQSAIGDAITCSILWRFALPINEIASLTLAVGVSLARSIESFGITAVGLKWPNDLIVSATGAKIGGILIESQGDILGPANVIIGFGINVHRPLIDLPIDADHADLDSLSSASLSRSDLLARMLIDLDDSLTRFEQDRFAPFQAEWNRRHAWQTGRIEARLSTGEVVIGQSKGVDGTGALLLEPHDPPRGKPFRIVSADIRLTNL